MATINRNAQGVTLEAKVVDDQGNAVDLTQASTVRLVVRNRLARWEVTPTQATAQGLVVAAFPDAAWRRVDSVSYQVRAVYPSGEVHLTPPVRISVALPL